MQTIFKTTLVLALWAAAYNANASLQSLDDAKLAEINGAEGIGIILKDVKLESEGNATLHVNLGVNTISLYGDKFSVHKHNDKDAGFVIGNVDNPIKINIFAPTEAELAEGQGREQYILNSKGDTDPNRFAGAMDIRYLRIAMPTVPDGHRKSANNNLHGAGAVRTDLEATDTYLNSYAAKQNSSMTWVNVPFACHENLANCIDIAVRLRADIFKNAISQNQDTATKYDEKEGTFEYPDDRQLSDRKLLWTEINGLNLSGSHVDIWGDPDWGLSMSVNLTAYIKQLRLTNRTTIPAGSAVPIETQRTPLGESQGETVETLKLTPPYSDYYTAAWTVDGNDTGLQLNDVYADVHIGNRFYQPLSLQTVVTPISRGTAAGGGACASGAAMVKGSDNNMYCPDEVTSDLRLTLKPLTAATSKTFYQDPHTKSNIHIREVKMGAGQNGKGANNGKGGYVGGDKVGYNFGAVTIEGLHIQSLEFTTRDLKPMQSGQCPKNWTCSF